MREHITTATIERSSAHSSACEAGDRVAEKRNFFWKLQSTDSPTSALRTTCAGRWRRLAISNRPPFNAPRYRTCSRPRPPRLRPDRHGQDRRVRAADPAAAGVHAAPTAGQAAIRALVLTPTRELAAQIGESFATYGKNLRSAHRDLRRRRPGRAGAGAAPRRRHPRRDAGPAARPDAAAARRSSRSSSLRARRSRPHARHGLHPRRAARDRAAARSAARRCSSRRRCRRDIQRARRRILHRPGDASR